MEKPLINIFKYSIIAFFIMLVGCDRTIEADLLLMGGQFYVGDGSESQVADIAIKDDEIIFIGLSSANIRAKKSLDARGLIVAPGFIDPHTHSLAELQSDDARQRENANYRLQGVTTVFNGNDGGGYPDILKLSQAMQSSGIGTNTTLYVGHGALRREVMNNDNRVPTDEEMAQMKLLVAKAMDNGALGLSTGLFYVPGSFSQIEEVIELAKVAAEKNGVYDSHIRDESTYNIGLEAAIKEVLEIASKADIPAHIAHIKALGVDVWGKSVPVIKMIEQARAEGLKVTADQYPWLASGTSISAALIPREIKAGGEDKYLARLNNPSLRDKLVKDVTENLRRRGGAEAVLITQGKPEWQGKTLIALAGENNITPVEMAIEIARKGDAKIASFNMDEDDLSNFMRQDWVMTSSDGSSGHPRKYASFPRKFEIYIKQKNVMPVATFLYRSSGLVADTFMLCDRGYIKPGYKADIVIFDPEKFTARADFQNPELLSQGVEYLLINGQLAVDQGKSQHILPGKVLKRCTGR